VTTKNFVFWDVASSGSCKNRRFGGTSVLTRPTRRHFPKGGTSRWRNVYTKCSTTFNGLDGVIFQTIHLKLYINDFLISGYGMRWLENAESCITRSFVICTLRLV
jgi:hypothetical protein